MVTDHLGNEYPTVQIMCDAYDVTKTTYRSRKYRGKTTEAALTTPIRPRTTSITVNNTRYENIKDACTAHGISSSLYRSRRGKGKSIKESLQPRTKQKSIPITDHKGNTFKSITECAKFYGMERKTLQRRLEKMSFEEAVSLDNHTIYDHLGNKFENRHEMASYYNITYKTLLSRLNRHKWSLEKALTTPMKRTFQDHEGRIFDTLSEMCKYHGITKRMYYLRSKLGWSLKDILTTTHKQLRKIPHTDPYGNEFEDIDQMCDFYHVSKQTYWSRVNNYGWSQKHALLNIAPITMNKNISNDLFIKTTIQTNSHNYYVIIYKEHEYVLVCEYLLDYLYHRKLNKEVDLNDLLIEKRKMAAAKNAIV